jgi:hypothetical protein
MLGDDHHLWNNYWRGDVGGGKWGWWDHGTPSRTVVVDGGVGATVMNGHACAFVWCRDGHLWATWWNKEKKEQNKWQWDDHGTPSDSVTVNGAVGVATSGSNTHVFVRGSNGRLYVRYWYGGKWQWSEAPSPYSIADGVGVAMIEGSAQSFAFMRDDDLHLWRPGSSRVDLLLARSFSGQPFVDRSQFVRRRYIVP